MSRSYREERFSPAEKYFSSESNVGNVIEHVPCLSHSCSLHINHISNRSTCGRRDIRDATFTYICNRLTNVSNRLIKTKGKDKVDSAPQESVGKCSSPSPRPLPAGGEPLMSVTRGQCDVRPMITFPATRHHWLVPNYTAW